RRSPAVDAAPPRPQRPAPATTTAGDPWGRRACVPGRRRWDAEPDSAWGRPPPGHAVGGGPSATLRGPPPLRPPTTVSPPTRTRPWRVSPHPRVRRKKGGAPAPRGG